MSRHPIHTSCTMDHPADWTCAICRKPDTSSVPTNPSEIVSKSVDASSAGAGDALAYAKRLAGFMWRENYALEAPQWEPCPDLMGVLTQIDNMLPGLMRKPERLASPIAGGQASEGASRRCKECCGSPCECPSGLAEAHTLRAEIARRIETFRYAGPLINAEEDAKAAALTKEWESLLAWADAQGERT